MSQSSRQRPSQFDPSLLAAGVVSLALAGLFYWAVTGGEAEQEPPEPMEFAPIEIDEDRLDRVRAKKYGEARKALTANPADALLSAARRLNDLQFDETREGRQKLQKLARKISYMANDVIPRTGYDGYIAAGEPMFSACQQGLDELLSAIASGSIPFEKASTNPPADRFETYRNNCGPILPLLEKRRIVTREGEWRQPADRYRTITQILQRFRWATTIRDRRPALMQLTDYERRLLMRWRIEDPEAYPAEKRRSFLARIEREEGLVEDYDTALARATLAWQLDDRERAAKLLRKALREHPDRSKHYEWRIRWIEDQMTGSEGAKSDAGSAGS
jgi:hypothetical protein